MSERARDFEVYPCLRTGGMGIGMTTSRVLRHERFLVDPHAVAKEIWEQSG